MAQKRTKLLIFILINTHWHRICCINGGLVLCKLKEMKFISEDEFTWFTRNSYIINTHGSRFAVRTAVCHAPTNDGERLLIS